MNKYAIVGHVTLNNILVFILYVSEIIVFEMVAFPCFVSSFFFTRRFNYRELKWGEKELCINVFWLCPCEKVVGWSYFKEQLLTKAVKCAVK